MKTILLLRHAKSSWDSAAQNDHDRPLNKRGERAAALIAVHLSQTAPRPGLILCSTAMRTRQTLAPLVKALGPPAPPISLEKELYLASEDSLLGRLQAVSADVETVLLIGHNDGIGQLAGTLAGRGPEPALNQLREKYPTGALARLEVADGAWGDLAPGACTLISFVRPRDLDEA